jgi:DNA (cytosine-5)-methyltransferase 1
MNELALFAGAGGGILGGKLLGWRTVCAVEWEPYPASVLCARQNDGLLPPFPIWDDVQTFDGHPWRGIVDVISGGFPCQDISAAGKGAGIDGERSGMWGHMARVVGEVRPQYVFVENSPMLVTRGLERVLGDLTTLGYDTKWTVMGAADVGANHQRDRIWIVAKRNRQFSHTQHDRIRWWEQQQKSIEEETRELANTKELLGNGFNDNSRVSLERQAQSKSGNNCGSTIMAYTNSAYGKGNQCTERTQEKHANADSTSELANAQNKGYVRWLGSMGETEGQHNNRGSQVNGRGEWWQIEPNVGRVADGVAARVDRLKAIGNGQVPLCAAEAFRLLAGAFN